MKPTLSTIERRVAAIEQQSGVAPPEVLELHLVFIPADGSKNPEWEATQQTINDMVSRFSIIASFRPDLQASHETYPV